MKRANATNRPVRRFMLLPLFGALLAGCPADGPNRASAAPGGEPQLGNNASLGG